MRDELDCGEAGLVPGSFLRGASMFDSSARYQASTSIKAELSKVLTRDPFEIQGLFPFASFLGVDMTSEQFSPFWGV